MTETAATLASKPKRRRGVDPSQLSFREYSDAEQEFLLAMNKFKTVNRRPHPTWGEALSVARSLGYRRVAEPTAIPGLESA